MRRWRKIVGVAIAAVLAVICLAACGGAKEVKGSCSEVVKQCQSLNRGDEVIVTVSGRAASEHITTDGAFYLSDSGSYKGDLVLVKLKNRDDISKVLDSLSKKGEKLSIKGALAASATTDSSVFVEDAAIIDSPS